jgi:hypothetical protein
VRSAEEKVVKRRFDGEVSTKVEDEVNSMMRLDEARGLMLQALRETGWNQVGDLLRTVGNLKARAQGIDPNQSLRSYGDGRHFLERGEPALLIEVIWSLIVQGMLVPALDDNNQGYPFLRLTEYGKQCVEGERILPHDPDGYLREFQQAVPAADPAVTEYLTEALQCYIHGLNRAAAVMLGGASEQAVLVLIERFGQAIRDDSEKTRFVAEIEKASSIFRKFAIFENRLNPLRSRIPRNLTDNLDSLLRGIFDLIRSSRNDAGHPASGRSADRDAVYSHLRLFFPYCERIYQLIEWVDTNPI